MTTVEDLLAERVTERLVPRLLERMRTVVREELARLPPGADDRLVDVYEGARLVGITPAALQRRAARGSLPPGAVVRHGRRLLFSTRALLGGGVGGR